MCLLIVSTYQKPKVNIEQFNIKNSDCENILPVKVDNKLTFDCHVCDIRKKAIR